MFQALLNAFSTLTILPVPVQPPEDKTLRQSVLFYPLVGGFIGGLLALVTLSSLSHPLKVLLILLLWVVITGALHLDGLGDCLDGFLSGPTPEDRRRIMKDPSLGVFGVCGLVLDLLFKYVLLDQLLYHSNAWKWLIAIPLCARWALILSCALASAPPESQGLGAKVLGFPPVLLLVGSFYSVIGVAFLLHWRTPAAFALGGLVSLFFIWVSKKRIGGLTGDGLGITVEVTEVGLLFLACFLLSSKGIFPF
ncbi:MAG TPA: adenosylcobinamide-GDP ribazoletransferase [bacterium]